MIYVYMTSAIENETQLHTAVVEFIRKKYPHAVIIPGLGEFQKTDELRMEAWQKGYMAGQPDLIIMHPNKEHHALVIELKSPKQSEVAPSAKQMAMLAKLRKLGYKCVVSNSYVDTICEIVEYMHD